ncbi:hypothetical protein DID88_010333 [Monilinia fructigena]|uniref:Dihydroorotate dehydrogenase catalytic domain-containing protein n=1 Tax=Monilinia fructigena TaxID=38457 RepID=A0A395IN08_9HELO|nr:hypothetical protein DID88_010333 [Monilinia fructigena]
MVKVSPDEDQDEQLEGIVEAIWRSGVDGVIVGNTTNRRDKLIPDDIKISARETTRKLCFATGGITNGKQALEVLNAGASVAQVYTALVYGGVGTITRIKTEISNEISKK